MPIGPSKSQPPTPGKRYTIPFFIADDVEAVAYRIKQIWCLSLRTQRLDRVAAMSKGSG